MSDLGDFSSPLPSYPTLPGSMGLQYGSEQPPDLDPTSRNAPPTRPAERPLPLPPSPDPSTRLRLATPDELGYSSVGPPRSDTMLHQYQTIPPQSRRNTEPDSSGPASLDLLASAMDGTSNYYSLPPSNPTSSPPNIPVYATVKKQHSTSPATKQRITSGSPFSSPTPSAGDFSTPLIQSPSTNSVTDPNATSATRVKHLEALCGKLTREKADLAEEFGRQRKSFMNQMAHSDAQLTLCKQRVEKYSKEVQELSKQVMTKDEELQNVTIAAGITEATIRERFDAERVKYEEEIASLTKIVSVQSQDTNQAMQQEREAWQREKTALHAELEQLKRSHTLGSPSVGRNSPLDQHAKSSSPTSDDDDLEISMIKAAENTKILRSVVVPLEEEIQSLKSQLSEANSKLREANSKLAERDAAMPLIDLESSMPTDTKELQGQLRLARSACHDLEMHTSQLKMQKTVLHGEIKSLSEQLSSVSTDLEVEKLNCAELKKTWEMANAHFIVAQDQLKQEIYRLHQKLERGEAASPLREITIEELPAPTILERPQAETNTEQLQPPRLHKRSLSSDEALEVPAAPWLQRLKSASWNSLHTPESGPESEGLSSKAQALEDELSKTRAVLKQREEACTGYEQQLQRVQEQMAADIQEKDVIIEKARAENEKFKAGIMRQRQQYEKLCRQMEDIKEEMKTRIEAFQSNEQDLKNQQRILRDKFTELKHDTQREIARMSEDRRDVYQQLQRAREEYDYLKTIQNSCVTDYQAQLADLRQTCEETESKLAKVTMELNSKKDQLAQVREMLNAERSGKEKLKLTSQSQLEAAKKRIDELSPLVSKYEVEKSAREEAIVAKSVTEQKSKDFISKQQELIEQLSRDKEKAANQVLELQRQVASLKHKLNHTEETQKDFVELSQSLQMKLAVMEEEIQRNQEMQLSLSSPST